MNRLDPLDKRSVQKKGRADCSARPWGLFL